MLTSGASKAPMGRNGMNGERQENFTVTIDRGQSLNESIDSGRYDEVNEAIRLVNFPWKRKGCRKVELMLVQFDRHLAPGEIKKMMSGRGYRPAFIEELLALGREQPDLQREIPIVALGSGRIIRGRRHAVFLGGSAATRVLGLVVIYRRWSIYYRFAFVRKGQRSRRWVAFLIFVRRTA